MMRTTVTLDDDVSAQLEREMRATGKSFKQALNDAVRQGLAQRTKAAAIEPFVVRARELGRIPGLDYSNVGDLLEVAEGPEHR
ncbi:MAG TPA: ribbon-helix-helix protein, CopG family [Thermoanaerobaculia bacterium]|nr:ribbon-helix-helix protein, CopG family [Thermoanaerobaculia bacterium]